MAARIALLLALLAILTVSGCSDDPRKVRIVVPAGFSGVCKIEKQSTKGKSPPEIAGITKFEIPNFGVLAVTNMNVFFRCHTTEFEDTEGKKVNATYIGITLGQRESYSSTELDGTYMSWEITPSGTTP